MELWTSFCLSSCVVLLIAAPATAQTQRYYPQPQGNYAPPPQYSQPPPQYSQPPPNYQQPLPGQGYAPGYAYPQQPQKRYENPIEFLPKFGKRMSEMVRRVFYGQDPAGWDSPPPGGHYSLDSSPRQYSEPTTGIYPPQPGSYQYPQQQPSQVPQPQYSYPPQQPGATAPRSPQPAPQTRSTPQSPTTQSKSSTRTYSPPKVTQSPPKTSSKPAPTLQRSKEPTPAPAPAPTTTRRSESTPREQPPSSNTSSLGSGSFLKGKKAAKPGRVISPYPPYKELDITGLESGSLALDPTTQKVFEVP